ncbi:amino acid/amide ABC transporter membrane protein 2, HAAT family [Rhizobiales bacterium GAS188]|nr:amino acid/amide ABC transporter membrane protein 2, HAAT family [Rhizobiales bacterium GAS188]
MNSLATTFTEPRRGLALTALPAFAGLALLAYALTSSGYLVTVLGIAAIYGIFCTGLNFFMGYTGQASFGQSAFAAIGGYGSAILCTDHGWEPLAALIAMMALSGAVAFVVGYPTLRLRGHYLAMATFALGLIAYEITIEWTDLTQGYMGYSGIPPLGIGGYELPTEKAQLVAIVVLALIGVWVASRLRHSRFGRALAALAGSEPAARALGIKVSRYKLLAFVVAGLYASAAGSLFGHFVGFISPEVFGTSMVVQSFTMLYLGGIGTAFGPLIGAVIVSLLPEALRGLKEMQDVAYTAILILILIFAPKGLSGLVSLLSQPRETAEGE